MKAARILVVEDEGLIARDIAFTLEELGYEVAAIAASGEDAVEAARKHGPDLVLMDIRIKGPMDGIEASHHVRHVADVPIIFLTAHSDEGTLDRAKAAQPHGYVVKPFEAADLKVAVEVALSKHAADRMVREKETLLAAILDSIDSAVVGVGADDRITFMNPRAEAITGWSRDEAEGQPMDTVLNLSIPGSDDTLGSIVAAARNGVRKRWTLGAIVARTGALTLVDGVVIPLPTDGTLPVVVSLHDRSSTAKIEELTQERDKLRAQLKRRASELI